MDIPADWSGQNVEDYLVKLREGQATLVRDTREFLKKNQQKRAADGREKRQEVAKFEVGQYVLLKYPNKPTSYRLSIAAQWRLWLWIVQILSKLGI